MHAATQHNMMANGTRPASQFLQFATVGALAVAEKQRCQAIYDGTKNSRSQRPK